MKMALLAAALMLVGCSSDPGRSQPKTPAPQPSSAPSGPAPASPQPSDPLATPSPPEQSGTRSLVFPPPRHPVDPMPTTPADDLQRASPQQRGSGRTGTSSIGGAQVSGGTVANAAAVVAGMAAGFRRCYNHGLAEDPNMAGIVKVTAKIGSAGEVLSATPVGGGGLSPEVITCVVTRVRAATFAPPDGGGATIVIPVTFVADAAPPVSPSPPAPFPPGT